MNNRRRALILLLQNLFQGSRGAAFLPVRASRICATWSQLIGLIALTLITQFGLDYLEVGSNGQFSVYGMTGALFDVPVILLAAWVFARYENSTDRTLLFAVTFLSIKVPVQILSTAVLHAFGEHIAKVPGINMRILSEHLDTLWLALGCGMAACRLSKLPRVRQFFASFASTFVIACSLSAVHRSQSLWIPHYDEDAIQTRWEQRNALSDESTFYVQPLLLQRALTSLSGGPADRVNLYFLGVAGYGEQDVFMKEIRYVGKLINERYGTQGRSIELINNPKTAAEVPIASISSMEAALKRMGEVMNRDKDVLLLYMTSHGSDDHHFSLSFGDMRFKQLDPATLRTMLDQSGIKRRIIIISACYAGGFIDALKSDQTLVITAAAADKKSFGCSHESEFTYFGKAYFAEALQQTDSFTDAFPLAKKAIFDRESNEKQDHADPRMEVGVGIQAVLSQLVRQRQESFTANVAPKLQPHEDGYTRYLDLLDFPESATRLRKVCREQIGQLSPARVNEKTPDAYSGLTDESPQWNRLMAAWQVYVESYCSTWIDPNVYRSLYLQAWRETVTEKQISDATRFYASSFGQQIFTAEREVEHKVAERMMRTQFSQPDPAAKRFQDEQDAAIIEFQREQKTHKKKQ